MFDNSAWGSDGRRVRDVAVVMSPKGNAPHLAFLGTGTGTTFCGTRAVIRVPAPWYRMTGCRKCAKAAHAQGVARITDVDGVIVGLPTREEVPQE